MGVSWKNFKHWVKKLFKGLFDWPENVEFEFSRKEVRSKMAVIMFLIIVLLLIILVYPNFFKPIR